MYDLLTAKTGLVHVCGHRGHSIDHPENTMAAFRRAEELGGTSLEIDIVLSADDEIVLLHDITIDRTTNGRGLVRAMQAAEITALDAGTSCDPRFAGEPVPLLRDVLVYARESGIGLHCEIKDALNEDALIARLGDLLQETEAMDWFVAISFDHQQLAKAKAAIPGLRTEGITHARHVDPAGLVQRAGLDSVSVEAERFRAEDGRAIHAAGVAIRCHLPAPASIAKVERYGIDIRGMVGAWVAEGVVDVISGDDVGYLRSLVDEFRPGG
ncbi:MAG: glycerophosphodiester phosphodiesterase family protein [Alphaproteobacteria bacterium]